MEEDERMEEEFYRIMEKTARLRKHFAGGFDFGLEPYDPMIGKALSLISDMDSIARLSEDKRFVDLIISSIDDFVDMKKRYELWTIVGKIKKTASEKDRAIIFNVQEALEDITLSASVIALVYLLFADNVLRMIGKRLEELKTEPDGHLVSLAEKAVAEGDEKAIDDLVRQGDQAVEAVRKVLDDINEIDHQVMANTWKLLSKIPSYHAAHAMNELIEHFDPQTEETVSLLQGSPALPYLISYLLYDAGRSDSDAAWRLSVYRILFELKEPRLFEFLRSELTASSYWIPVTFESIGGREIEFYREIASMLSGLGDRRAVPVLIRYLGWSGPALDEDLRKAVTEVVEKSEWHDEIAAALKALKEGERVFVEKDADLEKIVADKVEEYAAFHRKVTGTDIDMNEMNRKAQMISEKLNEAYHDDLDGLRPIDIPVPPMQMELSTRLAEDYRKALGSPEEDDVDKLTKTQDIPDDDGVNEERLVGFKRFETEWRLTPLPDRANETPLMLMMREAEALATSHVLKTHFQAYRNDEINGLYFAAKDYFQYGEKDKAMKRVEAILALEPDHLFALKLKEDIETAPFLRAADYPAQSGERRPPDSSLKPFMADVLLLHRAGLREKLEEETAHLKGSSVKAPIADDSCFTGREAYIRGMLQQYSSEGIDLHGDEKALRTVIGTLEMEYFALLNFMLAGEKVFYIFPKLVEQLTATELDAPVSMLTAPFHSCMLVYQDPHVIQLFHRCFTEGGVIAEYETPVSVSVTETGEGDERTLVIIAARMSSGFTYYGIMRKSFPLRGPLSVGEALRGELIREKPVSAAEGSGGDDTAENEEYSDLDFQEAFFRIVLNSLLYLSSKNRDQKSEKSPIDNLEREIKHAKSPKLKKKMEESLAAKKERCSAWPYVLVGSSLKKSKSQNLFIAQDIGDWYGMLKGIAAKGRWTSGASGKEPDRKTLVWSEPRL